MEEKRFEIGPYHVWAKNRKGAFNLLRTFLEVNKT